MGRSTRMSDGKIVHVVGTGTIGELERAPVAALRGLGQTVCINIPSGQELGDELQAADAPLEPCLVARGLDVVPSGDQGTGVGVEEVAVVVVADNFARFAGAVVEPPVEGTSK